MKISNTLKTFIAESSKSDSYWVERAKLKFAVDLDAKLRKAGMTYAAFALKLGTSAAYITKVFRGDVNMTIESMVKLARAADSELEIRIVESVSATAKWDLSQTIQAPKLQTHTTGLSATIINFPAANHDWYNNIEQRAA